MSSCESRTKTRTKRKEIKESMKRTSAQEDHFLSCTAVQAHDLPPERPARGTTGRKPHDFLLPAVAVAASATKVVARAAAGRAMERRVLTRRRTRRKEQEEGRVGRRCCWCWCWCCCGHGSLPCGCCTRCRGRRMAPSRRRRCRRRLKVRVCPRDVGL